MKLKRLEGDYTRLAGAYWGAVYHNRRWQSFQCLYCLQASGLGKRKVTMTHHANLAAIRRPFEIRHKQTVHDTWMQWKNRRRGKVV